MGACMSSGGEKGAKERSTAIDRQIEEDSRKFKKECKILLLGEWRVACSMGVTQSSGARGPLRYAMRCRQNGGSSLNDAVTAQRGACCGVLRSALARSAC